MRGHPAPGGYRYTLRREWPEDGAHAGTLVWLLLNPSTADDVTDDQTIRKITHLSQRHGASRLNVVNLFAMRSTDPKQLRISYEQGIDVYGPENARVTAEVLSEDCCGVVFGYGNYDLRWSKYDQRVLRGAAGMVTARGIPVLCCGTNKNATPKHPCYLANNTDLVPFRSSGPV